MRPWRVRGVERGRTRAEGCEPSAGRHEGSHHLFQSTGSRHIQGHSGTVLRLSRCSRKKVAPSSSLAKNTRMFRCTTQTSCERRTPRRSSTRRRCIPRCPDIPRPASKRRQIDRCRAAACRCTCPARRRSPSCPSRARCCTRPRNWRRSRRAKRRRPSRRTCENCGDLPLTRQGTGAASPRCEAQLERESASARRCFAPSPRYALPCMQARTRGSKAARRSSTARVFGPWAK